MCIRDSAQTDIKSDADWHDNNVILKSWDVDKVSNVFGNGRNISEDVYKRQPLPCTEQVRQSPYILKNHRQPESYRLRYFCCKNTHNSGESGQHI